MLVFIPLLIVIIPLELLFIVIGLLAAGVPVALLGGLGSLLFGGPVPWILAGAVGLPILITFIAAPFAFINGLIEAFVSIVWTLTYRAMKGLPVGVEEKQPEFEKSPKPAVA